MFVLLGTRRLSRLRLRHQELRGTESKCTNICSEGQAGGSTGFPFFLRRSQRRPALLSRRVSLGAGAKGHRVACTLGLEAHDRGRAPGSRFPRRPFPLTRRQPRPRRPRFSAGPWVEVRPGLAAATGPPRVSSPTRAGRPPSASGVSSQQTSPLRPGPASKAQEGRRQGRLSPATIHFPILLSSAGKPSLPPARSPVRPSVPPERSPVFPPSSAPSETGLPRPLPAAPRKP